MSTFDGIIKEYPLMSIDSFLENKGNFESTVFFLSHCHEDHMKGLSHAAFYQLLESRYFSKIYVSEVSKHLLENSDTYCHLAKYLESIPLEQPKIIAIPNKDGKILSRVTVTLVAAGHCLGSVMIYIEGENGRILYTGDFRLPVGDAARLVNLHDEKGRLKPLDALYVDTTFCKEYHMYFPSREEGLEAVISLVEPWLAKGPDHIISFICSAKYNYEFVFVELFKKFHQKIHISEERHRQYRGIKIIEDAVTTDETESRIHACKRDKNIAETVYVFGAPCGYWTEDGKPIKVRYIKLCAMSFKYRAPDTVLQTLKGCERMYKVCFSTHSSLAEVRDLVSYLNPKIVYPNVVQGQTVEEILELINVTLPEILSSPELKFSSPLGELRNMTPDDECPNSNSLPFYDDYYKIPAQNQAFCDQPVHSYSACDKDVVIDFDNSKRTSGISYEKKCDKSDSTKRSINIKSKVVQEESEEMHMNSSYAKKSNITPLYLESEKCELSNVADFSTTAVKSKSCDTSPLKWKFPSLSSDEENFDPNSYCSPNDKSDSETNYATSEEQDLKVLDLNTAINLSPSNIANQNNESSKCQNIEETTKVFRMGSTEKSADSNNSTSTTHFVHSTSISPANNFNGHESNLKSNFNAFVIKEAKANDVNTKDIGKLVSNADDVGKVTGTHCVNSDECGKTVNYRFINKNIEIGTEEMKFVKPAREIYRNDLPSTKKNTTLTKISAAHNLSFSAECQKSEDCNNQVISLKFKIQTLQDELSSCSNKLLIEISDDENSDSPTDVKANFNHINSRKSSFSSNLNSSKDENLAKENKSSDSIPKSNRSGLNEKKMAKTLSFNENTMINKNELSIFNVAQNSIKNECFDKSHIEDIVKCIPSKSVSYKSSCKNEKIQNNTVAKGSSASGQNFFIRKTSQESSDIHEEQNRFIRKLLPDLSSQMFSHKLPDISASKYERNHSKCKLNKIPNGIKTVSKAFYGSQTKHKDIELIELSSDESLESSPPKFFKPKCEALSTYYEQASKNNSISFDQNVSHGNIVDSSSDIEVLDESPSLIVPTSNSRKCNDLFQISGGIKRKSTESSNVPAQKSPKLDMEDDSPDIFDRNYESESTPEDLLCTANCHATFHFNQDSEEF